MTAAIVLAGGKSRRLGRDKANELLAGRPLLQHALDRLDGVVEERIVVRAAGQVLPALEGAGIRVVDDVYADAGPIGGIFSGLSATEAPYVFVTACDMPLLQQALVGELLRLAPGRGAVVPRNNDGPQPLCAVYARACLPLLRARIESERWKLIDLLDDFETLYVEANVWRRFDPDGYSFLNLNTEADLRRAAALLAGAAGSDGQSR